MRLSTFWSLCKLRDPIHPGSPGFSEDLRPVHLLHGLPHPHTPPGHVPDGLSGPWKKCAQKTVLKHRFYHAQFTKKKNPLAVTVIKLEVLLGNEGVGSPHDHLVDQVRVFGRCDQGGDPSVTPAEQGEPAEAQLLPDKQQTPYIQRNKPMLRLLGRDSLTSLLCSLGGLREDDEGWHLNIFCSFTMCMITKAQTIFITFQMSE